jgi:tRNA/rRNA methyltransferase
MNINFVLCNTSNSGNIGASARAIKVMGFSNLVLVAPRCDHLDANASAMASSAFDVVQNSKIHSSLTDAIGKSYINIAVTARNRDYSPAIIDINGLCSFLIANDDDNDDIECNIIFGNEQSGLSNDDVIMCSHILHINANPQYSSLNLAQAVQILAYELSPLVLDLALKSPQSLPSTKSKNILANSEQIQGMHQHLLQALKAIDFYEDSHNGQTTRLNQYLQLLWQKSRISIDEVNIIRGIAKAILSKNNNNNNNN